MPEIDQIVNEAQTMFYDAKEKFSNFVSGQNFKANLWKFVTLPFMGIIYWVVNAQGIRSQFPILGFRLHRLSIPGFALLERYEETRTLDLAHILAMLLLIFVWIALAALLRIYLYGADPVHREGIDQDRHQKLMIGMGGSIVIGDLFIFYSGLSDHAGSLWGDVNIAVSIIATLVYAGILLFSAYMHVLLELENQQVKQ